MTTRTLIGAALAAALGLAPIAGAQVIGPGEVRQAPTTGAGGGAANGAAVDQLNDFPTEARADYVYTCMAVNGQTREMLRRCSCSIDVIASVIPYKRYVEAETVLSLRQVAGERVGVMRTAASANEMVADLRRAQAEGEIRCF